MKTEKYVAYVGTYTHENSVGIHIYDVDVENGNLKERKVVPINNPSDLTVSTSGKILYSIADEGVESFHILEDGDLVPINNKWIGGMRGCYVEVDKDDRYLFVGGYHDGRVTMMNLNKDGSIGEIADGIFHKGIGMSIAERNSRPHVTCVILTPDQEYLCAVDCGLDQVKVYKIDYENGKLKLADIVRGDLDSAPRMMRFGNDGKYAYVLNSLSNILEVYSYENTSRGPCFEKIQTVSTTNPKDDNTCAASGIEFSPDGTHLFVSNAGVNSVIAYKVETATGKVSICGNVQISGDYPKALAVYPDGKHFLTLNHETNEITTFCMNYAKCFALMHGRPVKIDKPNCITMLKLQ